MAAPAILFDGVWKKFRRGERHDSLRDLVPSMIGGLFGRRRGSELQDREFWALKDVSFEVRPGEALGIIGPNGAGKSTILKLLTKILRPTRGSCQVRGRVGALIEVAAGFHPDLTGRENIYLQGAIMGMTRNDVTRRLDEIIDFAGVGEFVDTPVKRYSSGMNARLGFSIAAHCDPAVLLIDEVLAVGDMSFQRRCLDRMSQFVSSGTATVFVTHDLQAIQRLCTSALFVAGEVRAHGSVDETFAAYLSSNHAARQDTPGDVQIFDAHLLGQPHPSVVPGAALTLRASYVSKRYLSNLTFGFLVYRSTDHLLVYDANVAGVDVGADTLATGAPLTLEFRFAAHLTRGQYHVECHVFHNASHRHVARLLPAATFSVHEDQTYAGIASLELRAAVVSGSPLPEPPTMHAPVASSRGR